MGGILLYFQQSEMCIFVVGEYLNSFVKTSCCLEGLDDLLQKRIEMGCECEHRTELGGRFSIRSGNSRS